MKKILMMAAAVCGMGLTAGTDVPVNGNFAGSKTGDLAPKGWTFNKSVQPVGTGSVIQCGDKFGVRITCPKNQVQYHSNTLLPVKAGEVYEVKVTAEGTGSAGVGIYYYTAKGAWGQAFYNAVPLKPGKNEIRKTFTVPAEVQRKQIPGKAVFSFLAAGKSEITFTDFKVEKK